MIKLFFKTIFKNQTYFFVLIQKLFKFVRRANEKINFKKFLITFAIGCCFLKMRKLNIQK